MEYNVCDSPVQALLIKLEQQPCSSRQSTLYLDNLVSNNGVTQCRLAAATRVLFDFTCMRRITLHSLAYTGLHGVHARWTSSQVGASCQRAVWLSTFSLMLCLPPQTAIQNCASSALEPALSQCSVCRVQDINAACYALLHVCSVKCLLTPSACKTARSIPNVRAAAEPVDRSSHINNWTCLSGSLYSNCQTANAAISMPIIVV